MNIITLASSPLLSVGPKTCVMLQAFVDDKNVVEEFVVRCKYIFADGTEEYGNGHYFHESERANEQYNKTCEQLQYIIWLLDKLSHEKTFSG